MRIYDTTNGLADVTLDNLGEFVEWWLFWRACDALYHCHHHPNYDDLLEAVKATMRERNVPVELVPVVFAHAEHIQSLFEGDNDLYEFVCAGGEVSHLNQYAERYASDRYISSWGAQQVSYLPIIIRCEDEIPYRLTSDEDAC